MVLPIGGAVVSRSGVVLLELMPSSMCRYSFHAATGQMRWSDREERSSIGGTPQGVVLCTQRGGLLGAVGWDWLAQCPGPGSLAEPGHVED